MRQGLGYFHETIFPALPSFYRRIDTALKQVRIDTAPEAGVLPACWLLSALGLSLLLHLRSF